MSFSGLGVEMMMTSLRSDQSNFEQEWRLSIKKKATVRSSMSGVPKAYNNTIPEYDEGVKPNMSMAKETP